MIIARILQGIGISMFPIAFGIIKLQFPQEKLSIAQGIFTGVFTAGSGLGLALGGIIIFHYGWHFALLSMVPAAIILILIVRKFIHIKEEEEKKQQQLQQQPQQPKVQKSKLGTEYCCVFTKIGNEEEQEYFHPKINEVDNRGADLSMHDDKNNNNSSILKKIDIKGAIALSATIISFLMTLIFGKHTLIIDNVRFYTRIHFLNSIDRFADAIHSCRKKSIRKAKSSKNANDINIVRSIIFISGSNGGPVNWSQSPKK